MLRSPLGKATVLQDVGGQGKSAAVAINDAGQSIGYSLSCDSSCRDEGVPWSPTGKATMLQDAVGQGESFPDAINDAGWSVGESGRDAVLWSRSGKATDLGAILGSAWTTLRPLGSTIRAILSVMAITAA